MKSPSYLQLQFLVEPSMVRIDLMVSVSLRIKTFYFLSLPTDTYLVFCIVQ